FEIWCKALMPADAEQQFAMILPPIDVLMVWHAYLLNPRFEVLSVSCSCAGDTWYAEDLERRPELTGLKKAGDALATALSRDLGMLLTSPPSALCIAQWIKLTDMPFSPIEAAPCLLSREVVCPKCSDVLYAPYTTDNGAGYLQPCFTTPC
ncbi:hypothetical protein C8R44DRAFT_563612, partial [Mycena epipterygia]